MFDGFGAFNFLASWAHFSSGKDETELIIPNHSRQKLLNAITYNAPTSSSPNSKLSGASSSSIYKQEHITAIQDLYGIPMQAIAADDKCWESELAKLGMENRGLQLATLCMEKETVETWKGLAIQSGKLSRCSNFDVLCARVWKVWSYNFSNL